MSDQHQTITNYVPAGVTPVPTEVKSLKMHFNQRQHTGSKSPSPGKADPSKHVTFAEPQVSAKSQFPNPHQNRNGEAKSSGKRNSNSPNYPDKKTGFFQQNAERRSFNGGSENRCAPRREFHTGQNHFSAFEMDLESISSNGTLDLEENGGASQPTTSGIHYRNPKKFFYKGQKDSAYKRSKSVGRLDKEQFSHSERNDLSNPWISDWDNEPTRNNNGRGRGRGRYSRAPSRRTTTQTETCAALDSGDDDWDSMKPKDNRRSSYETKSRDRHSFEQPNKRSPYEAKSKDRDFFEPTKDGRRHSYELESNDFDLNEQPKTIKRSSFKAGSNDLNSFETPKENKQCPIKATPNDRNSIEKPKYNNKRNSFKTESNDWDSFERPKNNKRGSYNKAESDDWESVERPKYNKRGLHKAETNDWNLTERPKQSSFKAESNDQNCIEKPKIKKQNSFVVESNAWDASEKPKDNKQSSSKNRESLERPKDNKQNLISHAPRSSTIDGDDDWDNPTMEQPSLTSSIIREHVGTELCNNARKSAGRGTWLNKLKEIGSPNSLEKNGTSPVSPKTNVLTDDFNDNIKEKGSPHFIEKNSPSTSSVKTNEFNDEYNDNCKVLIKETPHIDKKHYASPISPKTNKLNDSNKPEIVLEQEVICDCTVVNCVCQCKHCDSYLGCPQWRKKNMMFIHARSKKKVNHLLKQSTHTKTALNIFKFISGNTCVYGYGENLLGPADSWNSVIFNEGMNRALKDMNLTVCKKNFQKYAVSAFKRGFDMFIVAPPQSGKTLSYIIACCEFALEVKGIHSSCPNCKGPFIVILCDNIEKCKELQQLISTLTANSEDGLEVEVLTDTSSKKTCEILLTTPLLLEDSLKSGVIKLRRVTHVVLEEADLLLKSYSQSMCNILYIFDQIQVNRNEREIQLIVVSNRWTVDLETLAKLLYVRPLIFIEGLIQTALQSHVEFKKKKIHAPEYKLFGLVDITKRNYATHRTAVFCNDDEVEKLVQDLETNGVECITLLDETIKLHEHDQENIDDSGNDNENENLWWSLTQGNYKILICTDKHFEKSVEAQNAEWLVHYSLPGDWATYEKRFRCFKDNLICCLDDAVLNENPERTLCCWLMSGFEEEADKVFLDFYNAYALSQIQFFKWNNV